MHGPMSVKFIPVNVSIFLWRNSQTQA